MTKITYWIYLVRYSLGAATDGDEVVVMWVGGRVNVDKITFGLLQSEI